MARQLKKAIGLHGPGTDSLSRQIYDWERGKHFPRDWTSAYAKAFQMSEEELFGDRASRTDGAGAAAAADICEQRLCGHRL